MDTPLIRSIEKFLREHAMPPTLFGRRSVRDPRFVFDLRQGRQPGNRVKQRAEHFMNIWNAGCHPDQLCNQAQRSAA